jgi:phage terminase small subunit
MRGRKPLPSNVVRLRGNSGKRRLNDAEPRPAAKAPACPACLGDEARKEWQRLTKELAALGLLTGLDRNLLPRTARRMPSGSRRCPRSSATAPW